MRKIIVLVVVFMYMMSGFGQTGNKPLIAVSPIKMNVLYIGVNTVLNNF